MRTAIILHGMPSREEYFNPDSPAQSNKHWLPWLQRQLILGGILAQTPELPEPFAPNYEKWKSVFEQFRIDEETLLIGHSCGGGFLVRWLSENKRKVGKVALVAPFIDPDGDEVGENFFDFTIDTSFVARTDGTAIFYSTDDDEEILESVKEISGAVPTIQIHQMEGRGHFTRGDMKTEEFPELRDFLI